MITKTKKKKKPKQPENTLLLFKTKQKKIYKK